MVIGNKGADRCAEHFTEGERLGTSIGRVGVGGRIGYVTAAAGGKRGREWRRETHLEEVYRRTPSVGAGILVHDWHPSRAILGISQAQLAILRTAIGSRAHLDDARSSGFGALRP